MMLVLLACSLILVSLGVEAQEAATKAAEAGEVWYKAIAGIIAIPASVLGIIVSWNLIRKTKLESDKLELEIREKEAAFAQGVADKGGYNILPVPVGGLERAILLLIRYVLLQLTLSIWDLVPSGVDVLRKLVTSSLYLIYFNEFPNSSIVVLALGIAPELISVILRIVYWVIFFGLGWPLFKDTCAFLNIPVRSLFDLPRVTHGQRPE